MKEKLFPERIILNHLLNNDIEFCRLQDLGNLTKMYDFKKGLRYGQARGWFNVTKNIISITEKGKKSRLLKFDEQLMQYANR